LTALLLLSKILNVSTQFQSCIKDQIFNSCCNGCGYSFTSTDELKNAVKAFRFSTVAATNKYGIMNCWDVSWITDMSSLFYSKLVSDGGTGDTINEPIHCWNVSSVTDMSYMFYGATSFNQPIDMWDVSSVKKMENMFYGASSFNQNLCQWYQIILDPRTVVLNMFSDTNCIDEADPNFVAKKSFCGTCGSKVSFNDFFNYFFVSFSS
jgi:hypothetical protein